VDEKEPIGLAEDADPKGGGREQLRHIKMIPSLLCDPIRLQTNENSSAVPPRELHNGKSKGTSKGMDGNEWVKSECATVSDDSIFII
jgi:hypothetical protein